MFEFKKIFSWFWPQIIEICGSDINPYLEVLMDRGRYILNSEHENYSYGSSGIYFRKILKKINASRRKIKDALILGFGVGSIASLLREEFKLDCRLKGVEIDKLVLDLGKKYFNTGRFSDIEIIHQDAYEFVINERNKYDLIIVDVTLNLKTPDQFETLYFLSVLKNIMSENCVLILNHQVFNKETKEKLQGLEAAFKACFNHFYVLNLMSSGRVFVAE